MLWLLKLEDVQLLFVLILLEVEYLYMFRLLVRHLKTASWTLMMSILLSIRVIDEIYINNGMFCILQTLLCIELCFTA